VAVVGKGQERVGGGIKMLPPCRVKGDEGEMRIWYTRDPSLRLKNGYARHDASLEDASSAFTQISN
jgi:hypothetical protein